MLNFFVRSGNVGCGHPFCINKQPRSLGNWQSLMNAVVVTGYLVLGLDVGNVMVGGGK